MRSGRRPRGELAAPPARFTRDNVGECKRGKKPASDWLQPLVTTRGEPARRSRHLARARGPRSDDSSSHRLTHLGSLAHLSINSALQRFDFSRLQGQRVPQRECLHNLDLGTSISVRVDLSHSSWS